MNNYVTVYDFAQEGFQYKYIVISFIVAVTAFILAWYGNKDPIFREKIANLRRGNRITDPIVVGLVVGILVGAFFIIALIGGVQEYISVKNIYETKQYEVVEGIIEKFEPCLETRCENEKFNVNGVPFWYRHSDGAYCYNKVAFQGGILKNGMQVRITYYNESLTPKILKMEVVLLK